MYETTIQIFNGTTGALLQQVYIDTKGLNKFKFKMAAINIANTEIYFVARNIKEATRDQTEVYVLKEISVDE